jgi:hypothetical protein
LPSGAKAASTVLKLWYGIGATCIPSIPLSKSHYERAVLGMPGGVNKNPGDERDGT